MSRRLSWGPSNPPPKHPYRDTLLIYGVLAIVIVLLAWLTDGSMSQATVIAAFFFVVASSWSVVRWRRRLRADTETHGAREGDL